VGGASIDQPASTSNPLLQVGVEGMFALALALSGEAVPRARWTGRGRGDTPMLNGQFPTGHVPNGQGGSVVDDSDDDSDDQDSDDGKFENDMVLG
jgi:hypothetical protein